jgi:hypothetical protein
MFKCTHIVRIDVGLNLSVEHPITVEYNKFKHTNNRKFHVTLTRI